MSDEVDQVEGGEEVSQETDAGVEAIVAEKMDSIFSGNNDQNQNDELEQTGRVSPENPDGLHSGEETPVAEVDAEAGDGLTENPTLEELEAAKTEAIRSENYERASELRDQIKNFVVEKPAEKEEKVQGVLTDEERQLLKETEGWTNEDLKTLETNPAFAKMQARRATEAYNAMSLRYAEAARNGAPASVPQPPSNGAVTPQQASSLENLYKNLDKFAEVAGTEMVEQFIKPLKTELLDPVRNILAYVNEQKQRSVVDEVNATMEKLAVGDFEETYGKADSLSPKQTATRKMLYDTADRIMAGAAAHNVPMSPRDAIKRAHLTLTAEQQIQASKATARKELVSKVKARSTQITSRPSQRVAKLPVRGQAAAEGIVENFWENHGS